MGTTAACFQRVGQICCDVLRLKIDLRTGIRIYKQPFIVKTGIQSSPTNFDDDEIHSRHVYDLDSQTLIRASSNAWLKADKLFPEIT